MMQDKQFDRDWLLLPALVLALGDTAILQVLLNISFMIRNALIPEYPLAVGVMHYFDLHAATLLVPAGYALAGLYPGYGLDPVMRLRLRVSVAVVALLAVILFDYLAQSGSWSRGTLLITLALSVVILPAWETLAINLLRRYGRWGQRIVLFGVEPARHGIKKRLLADPDIGWRVAEEADWPPTADAAQRGIRLAMLARPSDTVLPATLDTLPYRRILVVPDFGRMQNESVEVRSIGQGTLVLDMRRNVAGGLNAMLKRGSDLVLGLLALLVALPMIALAALAVKLLSPGPAFYAQQRHGRHGIHFRLWKLRTMVPDAEARLTDVLQHSAAARVEWERSKKLTSDPRIIPAIGNFLRRYSIDELPQLWNVVRGEMSLVGPRPLPDYHEATLAPDTRALRRLVRPGITGLWQVSGRSDLEQREMEEIDCIYIRNWSLWLDLHILLKTVVEVLLARGAR
ncbi:exopolysaccharide biosynthesis polyprenyl glycosylphosphotransferase [Ferrovibrio sp.]|uniref:exopolysaccharide biosynthesis polyprenyl glycosylphosphotransferase n=1 Tax=Ferrovibrio sp. TaxID=1917215 RepID=UPI001B5FC1A1|nr:exopolysaccharide biosynthesis polyprenyl glycosylphosphotransferase [Ferrovibrio sp.]MBP7064872.1 exopolysaccharide biosynthesis polyprenyl glycosylphosphotransferase [Ferrovibrio sp.]